MSTPRTYIAFPIPEDLRNRMLETLEEFRHSQDTQGYADRLMDLVDEISEHGMSFFFLHPVQMVGMSSVAQKTIGATINTGKKAVMGVSRQLARRLDEDQLRTISEFLQSLVVEVDLEDEASD